MCRSFTICTSRPRTSLWRATRSTPSTSPPCSTLPSALAPMAPPYLSTGAPPLAPVVADRCVLSVCASQCCLSLLMFPLFGISSVYESRVFPFLHSAPFFSHTHTLSACISSFAFLPPLTSPPCSTLPSALAPMAHPYPSTGAPPLAPVVADRCVLSVCASQCCLSLLMFPLFGISSVYESRVFPFLHSTPFFSHTHTLSACIPSFAFLPPLTSPPRSTLPSALATMAPPYPSTGAPPLAPVVGSRYANTRLYAFLMLPVLYCLIILSPPCSTLPSALAGMAPPYPPTGAPLLAPVVAGRCVAHISLPLTHSLTSLL